VDLRLVERLDRQAGADEHPVDERDPVGRLPDGTGGDDADVLGPVDAVLVELAAIGAEHGDAFLDRPA
jgi:hypothetical protein